MAIIRNNPITKGLSGMLGKTIVFRNWNGQTILANRPKPPTKQSALQKTNRERFKEATQFAKAVTKDPVKKDYYKKKADLMKLPNAYTAAITDYMRRPVINNAAICNGSVIVDAVKKDFNVASVEIITLDVNNIVVEKGNAIVSNDGNWKYTLITPDIVSLLRITVKDEIGNCVLKNILLK